jgi:BirA family biotin operon repressor/biotin-[acetyl-CoA-carboxylase] ligase
VRVGVGLNVSQAPDALPPGAVSLAMLVDRPPPRAQLAAAILDAGAAHYEAVLEGVDLMPLWAKRLVTLGRDVVAQTPGGPLSGRAVGVTAEGWLRLVDGSGREHVLQAGDVSLAPST